MRTSRFVLQQRAGQMRGATTTSEALMWQQLRGSQLGVCFRRQVILGRYIADFCASSRRLVVEIDGGYHSVRSRADARRDRDLGRLGYRVVRVPAALVLRDIAAAVALVQGALTAGA